MATRSERRVVHVTTAHGPTDNRIFYKECVALRDAGFDVTLVAVADASSDVEGIHLSALPRRRSRLARMLVGPVDAWRVLRQQKACLVHLHDPELIPLGVLWRLWNRTPVVFDAHENLEAQILAKPYLPPWSRKPVSLFGRALEKLVNRHFDGVVVALPDFAPKFASASVATVQNYPWLWAYPDPAAFPEAPRFAYVGAITRMRGAEQMITAVARSTTGATLAVAGPVEDDSLSAALVGAYRTEYVGILPPHGIPPFIAQCWAGVVLFLPTPNNETSKPTKVFEYMAAGRPFIASNFPYWRTFLGEDAGLFVDPEDPEAIAAAMDWIVTHPENARAMGAAGRSLLANSFTFESESQNLVALYDMLLATGITGTVSGPAHSRADKET